MRYIILTVLLFLNTTLSASNIPPEDNQKNHHRLSYMEDDYYPEELKFKIIENFSLENLRRFEITSKKNYRLVQNYYQRILGKLRHLIETIFSNSGYFNDGEEALAAENLFLEAYFPNEDAIKSFMQRAINEPNTPSKAFLKYISAAFSRDEEGKIGYFELRNFILQNMEKTYFWPEIRNIFFLPPEIGNLTDLRILDLRDNQLSTLPPEIRNLANLQALVLDSNPLTILPPQIGNLTNLERLSLRNTQLTILPHQISSLNNLVRLDLSHNPITTLPPQIRDLVNLRDLVLSNTQLIEIRAWIGDLTDLRVLDLRAN